MTLVEAANPADALRLVAVPVLAWAAYRDVQVRRVPTKTWYPLVALGAVLLAWDAWQLYHGDARAQFFRRQVFPVRVAVSLGVVAPFSYLVWRMDGFGGADAKALISLAVVFPTYPTYLLGDGAAVLPLPPGRTAVGVFSLTILTNTVILGVTYPVVLTARNLLARDVSRVLPFGRPVTATSVVRRHGSLLETPDGYTRRGLDVDALRMYLRWRGATLADLRADPERHRDPSSIPAERNDPGDGAIGTVEEAADPTDPVASAPNADGEADRGEATSTTGEETTAADDELTATDEETDAGAADDGRTGEPGGPADVDPDDEWGAAAFLSDVGWGAYGTSPEDLRGGLEVLVAKEEVWYSPGIPFIVPMFAGLVAALTVGDLLFYALRWFGMV